MREYFSKNTDSVGGLPATSAMEIMITRSTPDTAAGGWGVVGGGVKFGGRRQGVGAAMWWGGGGRVTQSVHVSFYPCLLVCSAYGQERARWRVAEQALKGGHLKHLRPYEACSGPATPF
jgi:hypothetical protein